MATNSIENYDDPRFVRLLRNATQSDEATSDNYNEPRISRLLANNAAADDDALNDSAATPITKSLEVKPNPLHEYATYTYGWTLYMLTVDEFEKLQTLNTSNAYDWNPSTVIISSAGKYNSTSTNPGRHPEFTDDFYFDDFKVNTVIGANSRTRGTNAINFSFTIVEPYGLTLLDRLIAAATSAQVGSKNYLDQPYLLELNFYGTTDLGSATVPISKLKKRFPIKFQTFKIRAEAKGSTYSITAAPYNHTAFNEIAVSTPVTLSVAATNLGNFFESTSANNIYAEKKAREKDLQTANDQVAALNNESAAVRAAARQSLARARDEYSKPYNVKSYAAALNLWCLSLVGSEADEADEIDFVFSGFPINIQASTIVPPTSPNSTLTSPIAYNASAQSANPTVTGRTPVDSANVHETTINAGTSIIEVINIAMRNSEYIRKQVVDSTSQFRDNVPVDFYKIIPQITKLKYDNKRKRYATKTVYHIVYYRYFNTKHPNLPYCSPSAAVKKYDYFYTGKNLDILEFTLDFDTTYYNAITALPGNYDAGNNKVKDPQGNDSTKSRASVGSETSIAQYRSEAIAHNSQDSSSNILDGKAALVASAVSSIYSNIRGDMINVKLKIVGDPDFIKQDDFYINPGMLDYSDKLVNSDGSVAMDFSDIFFDLTMNSPVDMDEATGLLRKGSAYSQSKFSGTYKVTEVSNEFSRGQFVQNITASRMFDVTPGANPAVRQLADQAKNQTSKDKMTEDAAQMLARAPTKDLITLGSRAAHANLGKTPVVAATEYKDRLKAAAAAGENADSAYKTAVNSAFAGGSLSKQQLFPGARYQFEDEKTSIDQSRDVSAQIKRTLTGGR